MDELDLFRGFRQGVAAPSGAAQRRASARLERAVTGGRTRAGTLHGYRAAAVALVALAGATVAALSLSTPWSGSPSFLERAQAALVAQPGTILHEKWKLTVISSNPACTVARGTQEIWIDQTPPYAYRAMLKNQAVPSDNSYRGRRSLVCAPGAPVELGGTLEPAHTLRFVPPSTLSASGPFVLLDDDPVTRLRTWIGTGYAEDEGRVQLDGRTVERIRMDPPPDCLDPNADCPPAYAYVDPETFYPVRLESPHAFRDFQGGPGSGTRYDTVVETITFEYLPRTEANLALTDIRAQHPDATGP
jgi:hypothetical protein